MKLNLNTLAKTITHREGKRVSLPIGQVKEVLRIALDELRKEWDADNEVGVVELLKRTRKRKA